jgi:MFS family permease
LASIVTYSVVLSADYVLDELSQMNWIISAFNLCSATFIPFWGQIVDIFGRTVTLEATLILMMIGSALCVAAPLNAFPVFILGRALQGLSVSGINVCTRVIMADKVTLKENAKNNSIFALFAGVSYAVGPLIGGFLTNSNWRWCFGINLPVAAVGIVLVFVVLRPQLLGPQPLPDLLAQDSEQGRFQKFGAQLLTIDFGGQFLFLFGLGLLVLGLTWGGGKYAWHDAKVVAPLVLGSLLSVCFVVWQYLMAPGRYLSRALPVQRPTLPWKLLAQRNMYLLFCINWATGMGTCIFHQQCSIDTKSFSDNCRPLLR